MRTTRNLKEEKNGMKKRIVCLSLAIVMLFTTVLMSGCSQGLTEGEETTEINDKASETTETITMFMITEKHVPTSKEVEEIKAEYGDTSIEYIEAKGTMEAYAKVAEELDKITKAKFRTHLVTTFYTIEEYKAVEEIMALQAEIIQMKKEVKLALKEYKKEKKAMGIKDNAVIESMFYQDYPEYAKYTDAETVENTMVTEAETIIDSYGIQQLKYPDPEDNQVDIICVCGYDKYVEYINKGWLSEDIKSQLNGASQAILTYVNEKIITTVKSLGDIQAIPNNTTIGDYTYLLINKELYNRYQYSFDDLESSTNPLEDLKLFFEDISRYEEGVVPITGDLSITNDLYWTLEYEYVSVGKLNRISSSADTLYYRRLQNQDGTYTYYRISNKPEEALPYFIAEATPFEGTAFVEGTKYYTLDAIGDYIEAKEYVSGNTYYTVEFKPTVESEEDTFTSFDSDCKYYVLNSNNTYSPVYTFVKGEEYFTVESTKFNHDTFSLLGAILSANNLMSDMTDPAWHTSYVTTNLLSDAYKKQLYTIQDLIDAGYYDPEAILDPNAKFAAAMVKGDAILELEYGDDYHMLVVEKPRADIDFSCSNMITVSSFSKHVDRAMKVITYINTNPDFRNLLQYGVEGINYNLSYVTDEDDGKEYPVVSRINNYYMMDIYKTGNTFIAYPEEDMHYKIWEYGKKQNADVIYEPLIEFNVNSYVGEIDFTVYDYISKLSAEYEEGLEALKVSGEMTRESLEAYISAFASRLSGDTLYQQAIRFGTALGSAGVPAPENSYIKYSAFSHYIDFWGPKYYRELS